jgi:hypothetical protein
MFIVSLTALLVPEAIWNNFKEQKTGKDMKGSGYGLIGGTIVIYLESVRKITKSCNQASIRNGRLPNKNHKRCLLSQIVRRLICRQLHYV